MMQAADTRHLSNLPTIGRLHCPRDWAVVRERPVRAYPMVVIEVIYENLAQLLFVQNDDSIETFPPDGTYQPLGKWILPRGSRGSQLLLDTHALHTVHEDRPVNRIAVPQQILGRGIVGEGIDNLLCGP